MRTSRPPRPTAGLPIALVLLAALSGCGQKGALYLPAPPPAAAPASQPPQAEPERDDDADGR